MKVFSNMPRKARGQIGSSILPAATGCSLGFLGRRCPLPRKAIDIERGQQFAADVFEACLCATSIAIWSWATSGRFFSASAIRSSMDFEALGSAAPFEIERNDRHFVDGRIVGLGERVLDQQLVQTESGARNGEVAFAGGHGRLVRHHLHGRNGIAAQAASGRRESVFCAKASERSLTCSS